MKKLIIAILFLAAFSVTAAAEDMPGLKAGDQAPDFTAETYTGETVTLSDVYKDGPVVLIFYRGGWCPYCNRQLQELQARFEEFKDLGANLVAVSVDLRENTAKTVAENALSFPTVSDPDIKVVESYGLIYQVPEELVAKYKNEYAIDLEAASGRTHHILPIPAAYIIDHNGTIRFAYADMDYKVRVDSGDLLEAITNLE